MEWGEMLEKIETPATASTELATYVKVNPTDRKYANYQHFCHIFIFSRTNSSTFNKYHRKAIVLMQIRFDGHLGFPGGGVEPGENPVEALNRELREEAGWTEESGPVNDNHYLFANSNEKKKHIYHFYGIEITEEKIKEIEESTLRTSNWGEEVLGTCRVPLYTLSDSYCGFPSFLHNNFIENSKFQLIEALIHFKLLTPEHIIGALNFKPGFK